MFENKYEKLYKLVKLLGFTFGLVFFSLILYFVITTGMSFIIQNYIVLGFIILTVVILSLLKIKILISFLSGFKSFTRIINYIINFILLSIAYVFGIGVVSIISKILKKHFLNIGKKNTDTYYIHKQLGEESLEKYYNQF